MAKVSSKEIIKSLKSREKQEEKVNITFRLSKEAIKKFRQKCQKESVSMASVMEMLMKDFIEN